MSRNSRSGHWNHTTSRSDTEYSWRSKEVTSYITTRSGLVIRCPLPLSSESEEEPPSPFRGGGNLSEEEINVEAEEETMAAMDNDPEIGSLNAHVNGKPAQAIVSTAARSAIEVKNAVLTVMPHFYGRKIDNPYTFLHEFCKLCGIQKRPAEATEDDYRLFALPFALKGETDTWLMRIPPNSIRTWADFCTAFLGYFFLATRTNALKKEIQGATQEGGKTKSHWGRFKRMLIA